MTPSSKTINSETSRDIWSNYRASRFCDQKRWFYDWTWTLRSLNRVRRDKTYSVEFLSRQFSELFFSCCMLRISSRVSQVKQWFFSFQIKLVLILAVTLSCHQCFLLITRVTRTNHRVYSKCENEFKTRDCYWYFGRDFSSSSAREIIGCRIWETRSFGEWLGNS